MMPLSFLVGVIVGFLLFAALAVLLAYRDGHPFGETPRDDDPPTLLTGWHGRGAP